jgi:HEAT repeat protein
MGLDAAAAVPTLARVLTEDSDDDARKQAALALSKIAPASASAVPALACALDEDKALSVRMNAAIALARLGPLARPAVPALIRATQRRINRTNLGSFPFTIQEMAALALGRATPGTNEGVVALIEALKCARTASKRRFVAQALAEVGAPAREAEPLLEALLTDDSPEVRETAKSALRKIREAEHKPGT